MAFIEFTETSEVDTAWFVAWGSHDVLAVAYRDSPSSPWKGMIRSRDYVSEEAFNDDPKVGWMINEPDADKLREGIDRVVHAMIEAFGGGTLTRIEVKGSGEDFLRLWSQQPFSHVRVSAPGPGRPQ